MKVKVNRTHIHIKETSVLDSGAEALVNVTSPNIALPTYWTERAGLQLLAEIKIVGWCEIGQAISTSSGDIPAKRIIHVVPPRWGETSARGKLANTIWSALEICENEKLRSISFPAVGVGHLGYPIENCAVVMIEQFIDFVYEPLLHLREIIVCLQPEEMDIFTGELKRQLKTVSGNKK